MGVKLGSTMAALALCLTCGAPAAAADSAGVQLKAEIDGFLGTLEASTNGILKWEGAERIDVREEGDAAIAEFTKPRISMGPPPDDKTAEKRAQITFDHVEIRRVPAPDGASRLSAVFPRGATLNAPDHGDISLTLKDAVGQALIDTQSGRVRESEMAFANARIEDKQTGDWVAFGPLSWSGKLVGAANGGWTAPVNFELQRVEFFAAKGPASGVIDRIAYDARSAGPDLAALNRLRDRAEAVRQQDLPPDQRLEAMLDLLPGLLPLFTEAKGELTMEGLVVRPAAGEPFVTIKKASMVGALTGLSGPAAALRVTLGHDGLNVAPTLLDAGRVPRRAVFDIGLEDVGTEPLRGILDAAGKMRAGASETDKEQAQQQVIGAAAMLNPTFRVYNIAVDTPDTGIDVTGEAKGSPLSPRGYSAEVDVAVRGIDSLITMIGPAPPAVYLPLLKEIGTPAKADDGSPRLKFHLASTLQKLITINGSDVRGWFQADSPAPGQPRALRPAVPEMTGADVSAVQQALAAAHIAAPQTGAYDGATALAVARFQKANALNVDGVVDAATRQKLGVKAEPPSPAGQGHTPSRAN